MEKEKLMQVVSQFSIAGTVKDIKPLGNGLINDTFQVITVETNQPNYVLQRINNAIFTDVDLLQHNIDVVTHHIRKKLEARGEGDINRKVLRFVPTHNGKTYYKDANDLYWRISVFIPDAKTYEAVTPEYSYYAGKRRG